MRKPWSGHEGYRDGILSTMSYSPVTALAGAWQSRHRTYLCAIQALSVEALYIAFRALEHSIYPPVADPLRLRAIQALIGAALEAAAAGAPYQEEQANFASK